MTEEFDHAPARLLPRGIQFVCPVCEYSQDQDIDLDEDSSGYFRVPVENRFVECEACGQLLDIGWEGWGWHDEKKAKA
ncbi:hypothetical protein [Chromobacterium violaceum]|uniref:Uncharacterized protein n=1 Tax=Chromobacterium violaceum TaxID=536 RepID=A0A202B5K7_CHRVL|nr:hypothetical protein [Chromobacterium violaceum]OVE46705.1 hypothetical protein CBW21_17565 [Chromobacterium violaceum]